MPRRLSQLFAIVGTAGAVTIGGVGISQASHGADDPVGHHQEHRHHAHHRHHHHNHHQRHGRDDRAARR